MFSLILDRLGSIVVQSVDEGLSFITFFITFFFVRRLIWDYQS